MIEDPCRRMEECASVLWVHQSDKSVKKFEIGFASKTRLVSLLNACI